MRTRIGWFLLAAALWLAPYCDPPILAMGWAAFAGGAVSFPLKVSANGRYLVDQGGAPFRIQGDVAWSLIAQLNASDQDAYLADRQSRGVNVILANLIEHKYANNAPADINGNYPFTSHSPGSYDFTTPNGAYFAAVDALLANAQAGATVLTQPTDNTRRLSGTGTGYIWVGGTATPAGGQVAGTYTGTITLTYGYTGN